MPQYPNYSTAIPIASQPPAISPPGFQNNFQAIQALIGQDHYPFTDTNGGLHKQVTLVDGTAPGSAGGQAVIYSKNVGGESQVFCQRDNVVTEIPILGPMSAGNNGYATLPGGIIIQWGRIGGLNVGQNTVSFNIAFPNNVFSINVTSFSGQTGGIPNNLGCASTLSNAQFYIYSSKGTSAWFWMAIGN